MAIISRAGSHAGRGFHFQDAIGVWLIVRSWSEGVPAGEIIPEGRDDYEIRSGESLALAQVKSRRQHLGSFSVSEAAEFVHSLWLRGDKCCKVPDEFLLILERPLNKILATNSSIEDHIEISGLLKNDPHFSRFAARTRVLIVPSPFEETLELIASTLPCPPLSAQVYYGELLQRVGLLADENGLRKVDDFHGLTVSDIESIFRRLEPLLDADEMEAALRNGYCDPVDFLTPILDSTAFYQGVDARPGHVTAGLVIERIEAREMVISALESKGAVLIIGQSGSGKSALMWESARASRHLIRWFEIKKGDLVDVHLFIRLARSFRASAASPVGFVLDDVGRGLNALWDGLVREIDRASGILLLGSMREEDVFLLICV